MKIVFDHNTFTQQSYGGISRYCVRLIQGLLALEHQVEIVAPMHRNRYLKDLPPERVHGVEFERFLPKTGLLMGFVNDHLSKLKLRGMCPDVLHETYYSAQALCPAAKGRVITVHDMIHEKFAAEFSTKDPATKYKRLAVRRADHVICVSHSTKNDLCSLFEVPEHKVTVVHHGFERFYQQAMAVPAATAVQQQRPFLFYVGSRGGYKNFTRLLKAVAARPALKSVFDVVAFGGGAFKVEELELISALGFASRSVRQVHGDDAVLGGLYSQAAAFVYPSVYEGFGLPLLEAMAHGCPVVTSNSSSMPEVVGDAGAYFDPLDIDDQADAICSVVFDGERRSHLIGLGRQRLPIFSWNRCALETQAVYLQVLQDKGLS
jgi:glycosyltransferase involved in cell wall biosynthesis